MNPPAAAETQPPLEILESGTGHGSLTLHLARAIQTANPTPPPRPLRSQIQFLQGRPRRPNEEEERADQADGANDTAQQEWDAWRTQRNAIIHTVDVSRKYSALAEKNVRGFRRGIYAGNIDFYVGLVENWIAQQTTQRAQPGIMMGALTGQRSVEPFLSYAILDMPSAHLRIPQVSPILKRGARLVVFTPSVTQIGDCVELIRRLRLPFINERVVELGAGLTSGRLWDVRFAVKKSGADPSLWAKSSADEDAPAATESDDELSTGMDPSGEAPPLEEVSKEAEAVMVCRPKVGVRTYGGGFAGVWRRIEDIPKP